MAKAAKVSYSLFSKVIGSLSGLLTDNKTNIIAAINEIFSSLTNKVEKVSGKGLSTNDFEDKYKSELDYQLKMSTGLATLSNIPVNDQETFQATFSTNQTLSVSTSEIMQAGRTIQIFCQNTSGYERTIVIPTTGSYVSMSGSSVKIAPYGWVEIHITRVAGIFNIRVGGQD